MAENGLKMATTSSIRVMFLHSSLGVVPVVLRDLLPAVPVVLRDILHAVPVVMKNRQYRILKDH